MLDIWEKIESQQVIPSQRATQPLALKVTLLPFQLEGLDWLVNQEESIYNGGILADEMGMGKTIQMISLMIVNQYDKPTLIICPTVAMMQWVKEIETRVTPGIFKVLLLHGNTRPTSKKEIKEYNVILTSYAIIEQGFRKQYYGVKRKGENVKMDSLIHSVEWGRVILDEAHAIKDRSCSTARAVFALKREKQWSMSGTPLQNRVGEVILLLIF